MVFTSLVSSLNEVLGYFKWHRTDQERQGQWGLERLMLGDANNNAISVSGVSVGSETISIP